MARNRWEWWNAWVGTRQWVRPWWVSCSWHSKRLGDLEDPFENRIHDVSMTAITTNIEINLRQMLGEKELPSPVQPVDGILW